MSASADEAACPTRRDRRGSFIYTAFMAWLGDYELISQLVERPPWRWYVAQKVVEGSPYRTAPRRFIVRQLEFDPNHDAYALMMLEISQLAPLCRHVNVERAIEWVEGCAWVTEFFEGWSLERIIATHRRVGGKLSIAAACHVARQLCLGLDYLHHDVRTSAGQLVEVIHRSIGPRAVLVTQEGLVKLTNPTLEDLGMIGRERRSSEPSHTIEELSLMSPEQAMGQQLDHRSNIYSVGAVLYELLTGEPCFRCESAFDTIRAVRKLYLPPPSTVRPEIPQILDAVVLRALAKDPDNRQPTAGELAWNLELVLKTLGRDDDGEDLLESIASSGLSDASSPRAL